MANKQEIYNRVKKVIETLCEEGVSWEEIEMFWKECFEEANKVKAKG